MPDPVHLAAVATALPRPWTPLIVGEVNEQLIKVARLEGTFVWHEHDDEDEAFLVLEGRLRIELLDGVVELGPGDLYVVPRGVRHRPVADGTCLVALVERASTQHTGKDVSERTVPVEEQRASSGRAAGLDLDVVGLDGGVAGPEDKEHA